MVRRARGADEDTAGIERLPASWLRLSSSTAVEMPRPGGDAEAPLQKLTALSQLPPMPTPDFSSMRSEACCGCSFVLSLTGALVGITYAYALKDSGAPFTGTNWWEVAGSLIYVEAFIAVLCLAGLMFGDPGTLKRSPENCFPLPAEIERLLSQGESVARPNFHDPDTGRDFCTRCMIWRPNDSRCHHCSSAPILPLPGPVCVCVCVCVCT